MRIRTETSVYGDRETLEAHAGIDVFLNEVRVIAVTVIVELGEDDVPDFHETVAFTSHDILRAVSILLSAVIVNFGAGAAGAGAMLPEVVFLAELVNALRRDMHVVQPYIVCLVIIDIDRGIKALRVEAHTLGQEFPCPRDRFLLEVIAERKVSEHFKESAVAGRLSDILKIAGADTFLAGRDSSPRRNLLPCEPGFHRSHAGVNDEKRRIVVRNKRETVETQASLFLEERKEHLAELIDAVLFHESNAFPVNICRARSAAAFLTDYRFRKRRRSDQKSNLSSNHLSSSAIGIRT